MSEIGLLRQRKHLMCAIERRAGRTIFDRDPYVKFLPLILNPVDLDWSLAGRCEPTSRQRLVIVAYGRDPIAYEGWLRFAVIATHSVLHCTGIGSWAVDLLVGPPPTHYTDLPAAELFGETVQSVLNFLHSFGVTVIRVEGLASPGDAYRSYDSGTSLLLRIDADAGLLPSAIDAPCFTFAEPMGYSVLNARHTRRSALDQLTHPAEGRMKQWPPAMRTSEREWVDSVVRTGKVVLGAHVRHDIVLSRMKGIPWLSEGLSYLGGCLIETFLALRDELVRSGIVPEWDEESVKLAMVGLLGMKPESSRIPVLEHWEYGLHTPDAAIVNFRNQRSLGPIVRSILECEDRFCSNLNYVRDFSADIQRRVAARRSVR